MPAALSVVARSVAVWARVNPWPFIVITFVVVFVIEVPLSDPPWTTWENFVGNAVGGLIVVGIVTGSLNLWPRNRRLHWRRYRRL
jgi:uncharacterized membrane protein YccC